MMSDNPPKTDLEDLERRLEQARTEGKSETSDPALKGKSEATGFGMAMRVGTEMVSALIIGVGAGLLLDNWLDTKPWFLVVFFFLGAGAGVLNVYRVASGMGSGIGYRQEDGEKSPDKSVNKL